MSLAAEFKTVAVHIRRAEVDKPAWRDMPAGGARGGAGVASGKGLLGLPAKACVCFRSARVDAGDLSGASQS